MQPLLAPKNAKGQNRTADTSIFSAVLYRLSYLGVCPTIACSPRSVKPLSLSTRACELSGLLAPAALAKVEGGCVQRAVPAARTLPQPDGPRGGPELGERGIIHKPCFKHRTCPG